MFFKFYEPFFICQNLPNGFTQNFRRIIWISEYYGGNFEVFGDIYTFFYQSNVSDMNTVEKTEYNDEIAVGLIVIIIYLIKNFTTLLSFNPLIFTLRQNATSFPRLCDPWAAFYYIGIAEQFPM